ncbi:MAG: hypothetical protein FJX73_02250 [Armatimonadetes bacterium]|nr:hypothetical protein [Armatimonadota bacterium]
MIHSPLLLELLAKQYVQEALREAESRSMAIGALRAAKSNEKTCEDREEAGARGVLGPARWVISQMGLLMVEAGSRLERFGSTSEGLRKRRDCSA